MGQRARAVLLQELSYSMGLRRDQVGAISMTTGLHG